MLREVIRTLFDDRQRGDDRAANTPRDRPPVLRRRTLRFMAAAGILVVAYGTLAPFQVDPARSFSWHLRTHPLLPGDAVANVLVYVPVGLLGRLLLRRRGSGWVSECLGAMLLAAGMSYLAEASQSVLVARVPSRIDWFCNLAGAAAGAALAPLGQRMIRNGHAWFHRELRVRPFSAAASAVVLLTLAAALMPFDLEPTPAHLAAALARLRHAPLVPAWSGPDEAAALTPVQVFDKLAAASCVGLVAFLLALAQRERSSRPPAAASFALTRAAALVAAVELLQLFTISHAADPRDLLLGWLCAALGTTLAWPLLARPADARPAPATVLRSLVMVLAAGVAARAALVAACLEAANPAAMQAWLPMAPAFDRPWSSLIGHYAASGFQYALLAGLIVLWSRAGRRQPNGGCVLAAACLTALAGQMIALWAGRPVDTAHMLLAALGAAIVLRLDRAVWTGPPGPAPATPHAPQPL